MLSLRLISAVTPLAIAGLVFGRGPVRAYGVIVRPLDQFGDADLRQIFSDPRIDVSIGMEAPGGDQCFFPAADVLDLARLQQLLGAFVEQPAEPRGTAEILAASLAAEQARDAAAPGGDDETQPDTAAAPVAEPAPSEAAPGETADGSAADAPGASAATPPDPKRGGKK